ncbi:MAG: bifunctional diaminohydroxyphosphoribosylaminopyrimidine deaminase/5-amino-6-(5-phosphoribosylamino)uracil reductase RibD [Clostridiales bacterium]|nr:bifunctional diaminohydroxyphosphoribosylaminopyrimidine deaminase/5-amino-6-(5-phosphoribosylamino)uracil reductase RibD [Clostridiales bacterium]
MYKRQGCGWVNPNPMVGAVIVKNSEIIGKGYHKKYGGLHAERNALADCTQHPAGATLYVTLEPCCHFGKTPPCADAIIESGIKTVVIGCKDSNSLVDGKGMEILKQNGIKVVYGVLEQECLKINEVFFHYINNKKPFVVLKYAMTVDGKIATSTGKSRWITGEIAREHTHRLRHRYTGIMVGVGTVIADDPLLTCRLPGCKNPSRIICDTNLRIPMDSKIVQTAESVPTFIATAVSYCEKTKALEERGIQMINVSTKNGQIDLQELMVILGERKIDSILLEGGATLNASALESGIVNKVQAYIAPKIFGGIHAKSAIGGAGVNDPVDAFRLFNREITLLGDDILLEYSLK